jgi:ligand-binding sensor domain-containing protein/signal transduction histidine kinase
MVRVKSILNIAIVVMTIACSACGNKPVSSSSPVTPTLSPDTSLQVNTYPPLRDDGRTIRFIRYGVEDGLSQNSIQVIFQDRNGFLWIGTQDGLDRFDGYTFEVFRPDPNDSSTISGRNITSIIQGKDGAIWVGTSQGLSRYDPALGKFSRYFHDDSNANSLINNDVQALFQDSQGMIWVGTSSGLDQLDPADGRIKRQSLPGDSSTGASIYSITTFYQDHHGILWIGTNKGLFGYDSKNQKYQVYGTGSNGAGITFDSISSIQGDSQNTLWIGTSHGLIELDPSSDHPSLFSHTELDPASLIDNGVLTDYIDRAGELWIGTSGGLDRFDPQDQHFIHYRNDPVDATSLSSDLVGAIFEDRGGVLWFGTLDGGLNKYDRSQDEFAFYHHINHDPQSLSGDVISTITPSPNGTIWIGSYRQGLNLFDPVTGQSDHFVNDPANPDSLLSNEVVSTYVDNRRTLWVGTDEGLDRLDSGSSKFIHYVPSAASPNTSIPSGPIFAILQDNRSTYWIGTSHGIRMFNPDTGVFNPFISPSGNVSGLADGAVRAIYQDRSGAIWFGTDAQGLFRLDINTGILDQFKTEPGSASSFTDAPVLDIYEDSRGIIWIATDGGGLNRYNPADDTFTQYLHRNGLPSDIVYGILEDRSGFLWLSTDFGLSKFDLTTGQFDNFTVEDGLQGNQFENSAYANGNDGRMFFGGNHGLTVFDPAEIVKDQYVPPVEITGIHMANGQFVDPSLTAKAQNEVTISYPQNSFSFSFTALSFSKTDRNHYKYELKGFDKGWQDAGTDKHASYTNLPAGNYTLQVLGSNSDGIWNEKGASVAINVIPPPWETWPFRGFVMAILIAVALTGYKWTTRRINAQKAELERIVHERTFALMKQNQGLEALYWADDKMLRVFTLEQVMQALVDVSVDILQADKSAVYMKTDHHGEYVVRVSRGFSPETVESLHFAENDEIAVLATSRDRPFVINDVANDSRWKRLQADIAEQLQFEDIHSLMYMPIVIQEKVLGILNVCSSKINAFDNDRQRIFAFLAQRASLSIENTRLVQQTKQLAISDERSRLAQELHDSAKQKAFAALAQLGTAKHLAKSGDNNVTDHLNEAENILADVIRDLTFLIQELYPKELKEKGLIPSLQNYIVEWESRFDIHINLSVVGERDLPFEIEKILYRVVLEGLSNIARHSHGTQADIHVIYQEQMIALELSDNGEGFDEKNITGGLGLRLIRERIESIGGNVNIQSQPGSGTRLSITVPVEITE